MDRQFLTIQIAEAATLGLETNGKGCHAYINELPGAFVRGATEPEALAKAPKEIASYLAWLGRDQPQAPSVTVTQRWISQLAIEDADTEILLHADLPKPTAEQFHDLCELALFSGESLEQLYHSAADKDWLDPARDRMTFYGRCPASVEQVYQHIDRTQDYYVSRVGLEISPAATGLMARRQEGLQRLAALWQAEEEAVIHEIDDERWTVRKVLRRFIWHDRLHGRAIQRIMRAHQDAR